MTGEVNVYGVYIPWGIIMLLAAMGVTRLISRGLAKFGFYRYVWHPALFDFAVFVIVMGAFFFLFSLRRFSYAF
ncbi:MAG: DUF1656 domain-containing protein [Betaproteobacteria bacterium]|nr:DUF1656 domain-containing protein [Betaproteobacteria bacterium]